MTLHSLTMQIKLQKPCKGSFINDVRRFLTIIDPPTLLNVRFLPYKRPIFWLILDPPTPPKIGHH